MLIAMAIVPVIVVVITVEESHLSRRILNGGVVCDVPNCECQLLTWQQGRRVG